jgi:hypothetical protein
MSPTSIYFSIYFILLYFTTVLWLVLQHCFHVVCFCRSPFVNIFSLFYASQFIVFLFVCFCLFVCLFLFVFVYLVFLLFVCLFVFACCSVVGLVMDSAALYVNLLFSSFSPPFLLLFSSFSPPFLLLLLLFS